ncbi:aspartyl-phosphate phosphatase Spo0E family protein [Priestia sp. OVS21]|nr:aspartyl-phosphate phosphatase Spo0E family protein [Priestia sp. OVS21]
MRKSYVNANQFSRSNKRLTKVHCKKRKELIDLGSNYGLLDKKTIKCSQDLDKLINLHMKSYSSSTNMFLDYGGIYLE